MRIESPPFWHQGVFLQPQHFQLQDLAARAHLVPLLIAQGPHFWGVVSVDFDETALYSGTCRLTAGRFLFDDATYIEVPGNAVVASRSFPNATPDEQPRRIYLGLRRWSLSGDNVTVVTKKDEASSVSTRFIALEDAEEVRDLYTEGPQVRVQRLFHVLRLFSEDELDTLGEYHLLPLAWPPSTVSGSHQPFIPPALTLAASRALLAAVSEVRDLLASWINRFEESKAKLLTHSREGGRPLIHLLVLATLNRFLPLFSQYLETPSVHPSIVYGTLRQLLGELTSYSSRRTFPLDEVPRYDHQDLRGCFSGAAAVLSEMMDEIAGGPDHVVPLPYDGTYFSAELDSAVVKRGCAFYLALTAESADGGMAGRVEVTAKLASRNRLPVLTSHALPGVPLRHLANTPDEIPPELETVYFAVDHLHEQWETVAREETIAFCWPDAPAGLQVNLLVIDRS